MICQIPADILEKSIVSNKTSKMDNISETASLAMSVDQDKSIDCIVEASFGANESLVQIIEETKDPNSEEVNYPPKERNKRKRMKKMGNSYGEVHQFELVPIDQTDTIIISDTEEEEASDNNISQIIEETVNPNLEEVDYQPKKRNERKITKEMSDLFRKINQIGLLPIYQNYSKVISDPEVASTNQVFQIIETVNPNLEEIDYQPKKINKRKRMKEMGDLYREVNQIGLVPIDQNDTITILDSEEEKASYSQVSQNIEETVNPNSKEIDHQYRKVNQVGLVPIDQTGTITISDSEEALNNQPFQIVEETVNPNLEEIDFPPRKRMKETGNLYREVDNSTSRLSKSRVTQIIEESIDPSSEISDYPTAERKKKKRTNARKKKSVNPYNKTNRMEETGVTVIIDSIESDKLVSAAKEDYEALKSDGQLVKCVSCFTNPKLDITLVDDGQEIYNRIETNKVNAACCETISNHVSDEVLTNCETPKNQEVGGFGVPKTEKEAEINSLLNTSKRCLRTMAKLQKLFDEDL